MHLQSIKRFSFLFPAIPLKTGPLILRNAITSLSNYTTSVAFPPHIEENSVDRFSTILQDCSTPSSLQNGKQVHAQIIVNGFHEMGHFKTKILSMYVLCGRITDAKKAFFQLERRYSLPWTWMIRGLTMLALFKTALMVYFKMLAMGISPDRFTFPYVIKACCRLPAIKVGILIHKTIRSMGLEEDIFVGSSLIKMYAENGSVSDARELFDKMPERDSVLWNVTINGYVANGNVGEALELFGKMRESKTKPNSVTFASVLSVCASEAKVDCGTQLHGLAVRCGFDSEASVANTLLAMYSKCRCLDDARRLFDMMPQTDLVTWNGMISGYVQNGCSEEASDLFHKMQLAGVKPDSITFASFLPSISDSAGWRRGKDIHGYIIRNGVSVDAFLKSALIDIYFKCRDVDMACKVFDTTGTLDVVICCTMISGYVLNGMNHNALEMFQRLLRAQLKPNSVTFSSVLPACASLAALRLGKEIHTYIVKNGLDGKCHVGSALIDMYAKCGRLDIVHYVFERIRERDSVLWNTMITNFSQNGQPEEAIQLFRQMGFIGVKHDCVTLSSGLSACANLPALLYGKEIHGFMIKGSMRSDLYAESALIDMYAKCGDLVVARRVFDAMVGKNEVSWNSMIAAYGTHGMVKDALDIWTEMKEAGVKPDHIAFLAIISACGHSGMVDQGFKYFRLMTEEYGIEARMEHYACIVDLFGRAGRLDEALGFIRKMPFGADAGIWGALLGACRLHSNVKLAELASSHLCDLDPQNSGYYVLISNIHATAGQWDSVIKVRSMMKERGVQKVPGCSWIEINSTNHMFVAADRSHAKSAQIYLLLRYLYLELQEEGYVPQLGSPLHPLCAGSRNQVVIGCG